MWAGVHGKLVLYWMKSYLISEAYIFNTFMEDLFKAHQWNASPTNEFNMKNAYLLGKLYKICESKICEIVS